MRTYVFNLKEFLQLIIILTIIHDCLQFADKVISVTF